MMDVLHLRLSWFLDSRFFKWTFDSMMLINLLALMSQVYATATASSVAGISLVMWSLFALIQASTALFGIKTRSWSLFLSMTASMGLSLAVITIVLIRS